MVDDTGTNPLDLEQLLEPEAYAQFGRLCLPTSALELKEVAGVVEHHAEYIHEAASNRTDLEMADRISAVFAVLFENSESYSDEHRALIRGAAEYFVLVDDADGDLDDPLGFDDDARILNTVLGRLGKDELKIGFE